MKTDNGNLSNLKRKIIAPENDLESKISIALPQRGSNLDKHPKSKNVFTTEKGGVVVKPLNSNIFKYSDSILKSYFQVILTIFNSLSRRF